MPAHEMRTAKATRNTLACPHFAGRQATQVLYVRAATSDVACGNGDARIIGRHRNLSELLQSSVHTLTPAYLQQELPAGDRVVAAVRRLRDAVSGALRERENGGADATEEAA